MNSVVSSVPPTFRTAQRHRGSASVQGGNRGGASARGVRSKSKTSVDLSVPPFMEVLQPSCKERKEQDSWCIRLKRKPRKRFTLHFRDSFGNKSSSSLRISFLRRSWNKTWLGFSYCLGNFSKRQLRWRWPVWRRQSQRDSVFE